MFRPFLLPSCPFSPKFFFPFLLAIFLALLPQSIFSADDFERESHARNAALQAILSTEEQQPKLVEALQNFLHPSLGPILEAWQKGDLFILTLEESPTPVIRFPDASLQRVDSGQSLPSSLLPQGARPLETSGKLRRAIRSIQDQLALADPSPDVRENAILKLGMRQNAQSLPVLKNLAQLEEHPKVKIAIADAIALIQLNSSQSADRIAALQHFQSRAPIFAKDFIQKILTDSSQPPEVLDVAKKAHRAIENRIFWTDFFGTVFRGISLGSVLLVVALGLAITFGLMGIINMAHGEIMIIGGYTVFVVQCLFGTGLALAPFGISFNLPGLNLSPDSTLYQSYYLIALPIAFLVSALIGLLLERSIIQFLYQRPLETLLATWGVSLVLQQLFRLIFGPANIPVTAPAWLTGSFVVEGVIMNYNRVFVIAAALVILLCTWLLLTKTSLGLLIRAVIQDRATAACMGVPTARVNSLTFALGSGLAGLAGALLALLGNIGPSTGQTYIVDAFMVVVLGGVGNLAGTVLSALSIGTLDQILQIVLRNPVIGKVLVLLGIILFLQWKPSGLFSIRSRSLDDA